jgi:hypothetical protein
MSLFLSQQKIPFQSVSRFLRAFAPSCETPPEAWAKIHSEDMAPGDIVVVFDTILSPFGDSTAGIGVADDDSFKAAQIILICEDEPNGAAIVVTPEGYRKQALDAFLAGEANAARSNGTGFYYAIVRPADGFDATGVKSVVRNIGDYGGRSDSGAADVPFAFLQAGGMLTDASSGIFDILSFGYHLFLDKEPPSSTKQPDLRSKLIPVANDGRKPSNDQASSTPSDEVLSAAFAELQSASSMGPPPPLPGAGAALPKMPSFFSQPKVKSPLSQSAPQSPSGGGTPPPLPAGGGSTPAPTVVPPPVIRKPEAPRRIGSPQNAGAPGSSMGAPPPLPQSTDDAPAMADFGRLQRPAPAHDVETMEHNTEGLDLTFSSDPASEAVEPPTLSPEDLYFSQPDSEQSAASSGDSARRPRPGRLASAISAIQVQSVSELNLGGPPPALPDTTDGGAGVVPPVTNEDSQRQEQVAGTNADEPDSGISGIASRPMAGGGVLDWSLDEEPAAAAAESQDTGSTVANSGVSKVESLELPEPSAPVKPPLQMFPGSASRPAPPAVQSVTPEPPLPVPPQLEPILEQALPEPPEAVASAPAVPQIGPLPPRKKKIEPAQAEPAARQVPKEPPAVKSGVAGLVSKLEQQASKASIKLEQQVDDIQNRLSDELRRLLNKVEGAEKRSAKSAEGLRMNLTHRMENATNDVKQKVNNAANEGSEVVRERDPSGCKSLDEKHQNLQATLGESFEEVRARAEAVAKTFEDTIAGKSSEALAELETLRDTMKTQLQQLHDAYEKSLQSSFDHLKVRLDKTNSSIVTAMETRYDYLQAELSDMQHRSLEQLEQTKSALLQKLSREITVAQAEISNLQSVALEESVLPRLKQHREELRVIIGEFQHKLTDDLEKRGESKVRDFQPLLDEKKRKLSEMLDETNKVKAKIQEQLKDGLESIFSDLKDFVARSTEQAQTVHKRTEEQLTEIDRAVRALADPSSIEGDMELLSERNDVLEKLEEVTDEAKDEVLGTLRRLLAGLEEKSKHLQEEMITSMEEDAYVVRRASEQALIAVREAINESFVAIQTAQDERMPM